MMSSDLTVYIVDDDASVRDALSLLLSLKSYRTAVFSSAEAFLSAWKKEWTGCLILDIRMSGMTGLALQEKLLELECHLPVIMVTGHGDVASARQAFKALAVDFLEKPIDDVKLIAAIEESMRHQSSLLRNKEDTQKATSLFQTLTPREREVLDCMVGGKHNREIALKLDISVRTVEVHKARIMIKLDVKSLADLVRLYSNLDLENSRLA